jgi:hypothetical protein
MDGGRTNLLQSRPVFIAKDFAVILEDILAHQFSADIR